MNLTFNPGLNLLRITQRKLRKFLGFIFLLLLIAFGFFGIYILIAESKLNIFSLSLLTDMFIFYLIQRKEEKKNIIKQINPEKEIEISLFLDSSAQQALEKSWVLCWRKNYPSLRPIHLFNSFLENKEFKKILKRLNCLPKEVKQKTKHVFKNPNFRQQISKGEKKFNPKIASDVKRIFDNAYLFALENQKKQISALDILWAISQERNLVSIIFEEFGIEPREISRVIQWTQLENKIKEEKKSFLWRSLLKPKGKLDRAMTAATTPWLDKVSRDLTLLARDSQFETILGRGKEIKDIFNLFASGQIGVVLVGADNIGKRSILKKLAQLMAEEKVPGFLQDKRLVELDVSSLVALSKAREKGEEYLKRIIFEVARAGNIVLVISNIDRLVGLRAIASGLDFSEIMASGIQSKSFFLIGTCRPDDFAAKVENQILGQDLSRINVNDPPEDLLWQILAAKIFAIEEKLHILFSENALEEAIDLAENYIYGKSLTAKAIDLLIEAGYYVRQERGRGALVKDKDIAELVSKKSNVPLGEVSEIEREKLLELEKLIHQRLVNQEEAVRAVASSLRRGRLRTQKGERPLANFLFVGPTGVGKTELAKSLARVYFGSEEKMIRLDMSEYQDKSSLARMIGFRGGKEINRGYLTEAIKRRPHSLLLLDEIEKAHPDILNLFLQVMDDGRLTDASGETINFTNIILIATSNAGTNFIQREIRRGVNYNDIQRQLNEKVLLEKFSPEFLNRFDKIALFKSLSLENVEKIVYIFLKELREKLEDKGVELEVEEEAIEELAKQGYDPMYGARSLRRLIQDKVEDQTASMFLENKFRRRDKLILKKGLVFEVEKAPKI